jgi:Uma2 family endonuclease
MQSMMQAVVDEGQAVRRLTRAEFDQLVDAGAFMDERVELVRGVLVEMSPIGEDHCQAVEILNELFTPKLVGRARVRVQMALAASDESEPQPDMLIVHRKYKRGTGDHPAKAVLAIEVASSSLHYDRSVKAALYAESGVPEYWLVDVVHRAVEVYSRPVKGKYQRMTTHAGREVISPRAFPDVTVRVAALFPFAKK